MHSTRFFLVLAAALFLGTAFAAQQGEKWEITTKMSMEGFAMPASTSSVCTLPGQDEENFIPKQDDCDVSQVKNTGNKTTFKMVCTGDEPMTGTGEFDRTGTDAYKGRVRLAGQDEDGESYSMDLQFAGRKTGACNYVSGKAMAAKAEAMADQATNKVCEDSARKMEYVLFFGEPAAGIPADMAACKSKTALLCGHSTTVMNEMRQPAKFREYHRSTGGKWRKSATLCKQNPQATADTAFRNAVAARDFRFVADHFDQFEAEARKFAGVRCTGRDLTSMSKLDFFPVCQRARK